MERKAEEAQGFLGAEATECSLLQLRLFSESCRNRDELIWQEDPVREHNSAEITRKQFCLNSSHKHHHNFRPDQIAYKEQTLLHAIIVQLSEKSHSSSLLYSVF